MTTTENTAKVETPNPEAAEDNSKKKPSSSRKQAKKRTAEDGESNPQEQGTTATKKLKAAPKQQPEDNSNSSDSSGLDEQDDDDAQVENDQGEAQDTTQISEEDDNNSAWDEDIHRAFVEAVFKIGMRQASPSVILELMRNDQNLPLTTERVKSRLQKYRNNGRKSNAAFLHEYDNFLSKALAVGRAGGSISGFTDPGTIMEMIGLDKLMGGDVAAFLTYAVLQEEAERKAAPTGAGAASSLSAPPQQGGFFPAMTAAIMADQNPASAHAAAAAASLTPQQVWKGSQELSKYFTGSKISAPVLTEAEKRTPLGVSMSHVIAMFYSMTHQVMKLRHSNRTAPPSRQAVAAVGEAEQPPQQQQKEETATPPAPPEEEEGEGEDAQDRKPAARPSGSPNKKTNLRKLPLQKKDPPSQSPSPPLPPPPPPPPPEALEEEEEKHEEHHPVLPQQHSPPLAADAPQQAAHALYTMADLAAAGRVPLSASAASAGVHSQHAASTLLNPHFVAHGYEYAPSSRQLAAAELALLQQQPPPPMVGTAAAAAAAQRLAAENAALAQPPSLVNHINYTGAAAAAAAAANSYAGLPLASPAAVAAGAVPGHFSLAAALPPPTGTAPGVAEAPTTVTTATGQRIVYVPVPENMNILPRQS